MSDPLLPGTDVSAPQAIVGVILGAHGVHGEVRVRVWSEVPGRFDPGQTLFLQEQKHRILSCAQSRQGITIIKLEGVETEAQARALTGQELSALANGTSALSEDEYFHYQLIDLQVLTEEGEDLGLITEIIATGSNDVYVVAGPSGEILLPALAQVIRQVNVPAGTMTVRLMEGLR